MKITTDSLCSLLLCHADQKFQIKFLFTKEFVCKRADLFVEVRVCVFHTVNRLGKR